MNESRARGFNSQRMVNQKKSFYNWQTSGPGVPWHQLILGVLVPITIFYTLHRLGRPLTGALIAIAWSISLLAIKYGRSRNIELFPALAIPVILIEFIGTLITRNPDFYLASAAIDNVLWGFVFLGSLLFTRPLIQIFAELLNPGLGSQEFLSHFKIPLQLYRSAWKILTVVWAMVSFLKAIVLILSQLNLSLEAFLVVRTAAGFPVLVVMLLLTYRFPGWYWQRPRGVKL